ncbi:MAG: Smr/MutS family protein [Betaproteobacteria bacterium]
MKKKKSAEQFPVEFKNDPFTSLKGFTPPARKKSGALPSRKEERSEDDSALFLQAVSGARKLEKDATAAPGPTEHKAAEQPNSVASEDSLLFLQALQKIGNASRDQWQVREEANEPRNRSSSGRKRQLRRGTIRISQELDLHGFLRDEAITRLEQFIARAYSRGFEAVLVITGKGYNSSEGPVLRGAVAAWLRESGRGMVAEFSPAPRDKGGSGAFVVFLKKR